MASDDDTRYRKVIDRLVHSRRVGQGQICSKRVRAGVWNNNRREVIGEEQHAINGLLTRLRAEDRDIVARMLEDAFVSGVHETLVVLHEEQADPFDKGYEGTPFHDFVGRLGGWEWPVERERF